MHLRRATPPLGWAGCGEELVGCAPWVRRRVRVRPPSPPRRPAPLDPRDGTEATRASAPSRSPSASTMDTSRPMAPEPRRSMSRRGDSRLQHAGLLYRAVLGHSRSCDGPGVLTVAASAGVGSSSRGPENECHIAYHFLHRGDFPEREARWTWESMLSGEKAFDGKRGRVCPSANPPESARGGPSRERLHALTSLAAVS